MNPLPPIHGSLQSWAKSQGPHSLVPSSLALCASPSLPNLASGTRGRSEPLNVAFRALQCRSPCLTLEVQVRLALPQGRGLCFYGLQKRLASVGEPQMCAQSQGRGPQHTHTALGGESRSESFAWPLRVRSAGSGRGPARTGPYGGSPGG